MILFGTKSSKTYVGTRILPYDAEVEYLDVKPLADSSSELVIQSDYVPSNVAGDSIFFKFACLNNASSQWAGNFNNYVNEPTRVTRCIFYSSSYGEVYSGWQRADSSQTRIVLGTTKRQPIEGRISSNATYSINGIDGNLNPIWGNANNNPIRFIICSSSATNSEFRWRTYYWRIESNGNVLHDYRFVRMRSGRIRVYDFALDKFVLLSNGEYDIPESGIVSVGPDKSIPYVTDGLAAMWDGEWNSGIGLHDPKTLTWKDLVGGLSLSLNTANPQSAWNEKCFIVNNNSNIATCDFTGLDSDKATLEISWKYSSYGNWNIFSFPVFSSTSTSQIGFQVGFTTDGSYSRYYGGNAQFSNTKFRIRNLQPDGNGTFTHIFSRSEATAVYVNGINSNPEKITNYFASYPAQIRFPDSRYATNFNASIYSIRLYDRALTSEEIAANREVDVRRFGIS